MSFYNLMKKVLFTVFCTFVFAGAVNSAKLNLGYVVPKSMSDDWHNLKKLLGTPYKPKIVCCKNNPANNKTSNLYVIDSNSLVPKLKENFLLPYIEKNVSLFDSSPKQKIKINSKWYSIPEILNSTNEIRKKIMHALQDNIKGDDDLLQLDLIGVKKSKSVFCYKRVTEGFFSSINIKMNMIANSVKKSVDLLSLKDNSTMVNESVDLLGLEFNFTTDSLWVEFGPIRKKMQLDASVNFDFVFKKKGDSSFVKTIFKSFFFEFPGITAEATKDLLLHVEKDNLKIFITKAEIDDNVVLDDFVNNFGCSMYYNSIDEYKIPFLDDGEFSVRGMNYSLRKIAEVVDDYGKIVQFALTDCDDNLKVDFTDAKKKIDSIVDKKIPLGGVAVLKKVLKDEEDEFNDHDFIVLKDDSTMQASGVLQLYENKNVLVYKIWPKSVKYAEDIDFDSFNVSNPNVQYEIYVKFIYYTSKCDSGWCGCYEMAYIDKIVLKLTDKVRSFDIGIFKAESGSDRPFEFAKMNYNVCMKEDSDSLDRLHSSIVLKPSSLTIRAGDVQVQSLKKSDKNVIRYDFNNGKWIVPSPLMRFTSFSKDDLVEHVYAILNSLRELRNHVDVDTQSKTSLYAAKEIETAIRNFNKIICGKDSENNKNCLVDKTDEKYTKSFSDIYDFAKKFNKAWNVIFGKKLSGLVCQIKFLDANKKEIPVVDKRLNGKMAYVKVSFNMNFNLRPYFALEFAEILRSRLTDLPTESRVQVDKKSNVLFEFVADLRK